MKKYILILSAAILSAISSAAQTDSCGVHFLPFLTNFDTLNYYQSNANPGDSLPPCWHSTYSGTTIRFRYVMVSWRSRTMLSMPFPARNIVATPRIAVNGIPLHISYSHANIYNNPYTYEVGWMTDATDTSTFTPLAQYTVPARTTQLLTQDIYTDTLPADTVCIGFRRVNPTPTSQCTLYVTDVSVVAFTGCRHPSALCVESVTDATALLHWTEQSHIPTSYQVIWSQSDSPTDSTALWQTVNDTVCLLTALNANTTYHVWVRAVCDTSSPMMWGAENSFTTQLNCYPLASLTVPQIGSTEAGVQWQFDEWHYRQASDLILTWRDTADTIYTTTVIPSNRHNVWLSPLLPGHTYSVEARTLCDLDTASVTAHMFTTGTSAASRPLLMASTVDSSTIRAMWTDPTVHTIEYRASADYVWQPIYVTGDTLLIVGLEPSTTYRLRAVKGVEPYIEYSDIVSVSTGCGMLHVPYRQAYDENAAACWSQPVSNGVGLNPDPRWNHTALYLSTRGVVIMPSTDIEMQQLQIHLAYTKYLNAGLYTFDVGVADNMYDTASITWLHTVYLPNALGVHGDTNLTFSAYNGTGRHLALRCPSNQTTYFGIDTLNIDVAVCFPVEEITLDSVSTHTVMLAWPHSPTASAYLLQYGVSGSIDTTITVYDTTATLTGLLPSSDYIARVYAICSTGDTTNGSSPLLFHTPCGDYATLPLYEDFSTTEQMPECWTAVAQTQAYPATLPMFPKVQSGRLAFSSLRDTCIAASPLIPASGDRIHVGFRLTMSHNTNLVFTAGVMTSLTDTSTFIPLLTVPTTISYSDTYFEFSTDTMPQCDSAEQYYVAFRFFCRPGASRMTCSIDEVSITSLDYCRQVENATFSNVGIHSIALEWDTTGADAYLVTCSSGGSTVWLTATQGSITFDSLLGNTRYNFTISSICGSDISLPYDAGSVITSCDVYPLPFYDNFNTYTPGYMPTCWDINDNDGFGTGRVVADHTYGNTGNALSTLLSTVVTPMVVVPEGGLRVSFLASCANPTLYQDLTGYVGTYLYAGVARVINGEIQTADSLSSVYIINEHIPTSEWNEYTFYADSAQAGDTIVVVLLGSLPAVYIDEFHIDEVTCRPPRDISTRFVGHDSITLAWSNLYANTTRLQFVCSPTVSRDDSIATTIYASAADSMVGFGGLMADTAYHFWVRAMCDTITPDHSRWEELPTVYTAAEPICLSPTELHTTAVDTTSATVAWSMTEEGGQFHLHLIGEADFYTADTHFTITNLQPATTYKVTVRALCGETLYSLWSDTVIFSTDSLTQLSTPAVCERCDNMHLSPNPANSKVTVALPAEGGQLSIIDMWGRQVWSAAAESGMVIDLNGWPRGVYLVRYTFNGIQFTARLVVG